MKERVKQLAEDHWDGYAKPLLEAFNVSPTTADGFNYQSAFIHGFKHGVEDERNRAHATSNAAFENDTPIAAYAEATAMGAEALDMWLPEVVMDCSASECEKKYIEELGEFRSCDLGTLEACIEAWDVKQAAQTWTNRTQISETSANKAAKAFADAALLITDLYHAGHPVMKAKRIMRIKNAARAKYSSADCARILADV